MFLVQSSQPFGCPVEELEVEAILEVEQEQEREAVLLYTLENADEGDDDDDIESECNNGAVGRVVVSAPVNAAMKTRFLVL